MPGSPQFVDISSYQGTVDFIQYVPWSKQWDGISRIAMKSTEGYGFTDPNFASNRAGALNAGVDVIIYYHFGRPDFGNLAESEANWQRSVVGSIRSNDQLVLDIEKSGFDTGNWCLEWLGTQEGNYSMIPAIYSYPSFISQFLQNTGLNQYPLWYANWTFDPNSRPVPPYPWTSYEALQYTDRATNVPGLSGSVDCSVYLMEGRNMNIGQSALDTWNSTAFMFGGVPLNSNTGIASAWFSIYNRGIVLPPPTVPEHSSVGWNGSPITVMEFANLRAEWDTNAQLRWFRDGVEITF